MANKKELIDLIKKKKTALNQLTKEAALNDLFLFNKVVLGVEDGKDDQGNERAALGQFHQDLCHFVRHGKTKKKLILMPRGHLKALKTDGTQVLTPTGFRKYKDLQVGDEVIGGDGKPTKIKIVHPVSKMELYRVTTNDGREIVCNDEHLFRVRVQANSKKWSVRPLKWIRKRYSKERFDKRDGKTYFEHPVQLEPIKTFFRFKNLPIDPYTLGMWLGDGHSAGSRITSADPECFNYTTGYNWHKQSGKYLYDTNGLHKKLRLSNLLGNKHIPENYFISSYRQRLELLRGMMDTDGTCHKEGGIGYFSNTNYRLVTDFIKLVRSLGGVAMLCKVDMEVNGEPYDSWIVSVRLPDDVNPFNLTRKKQQYTGLKRDLTINIVSIERVEDDNANCITVESEDGMFIADDYFPTHNSTVVTVGYALQRIARNKNVRILISSATGSMAEAFLRQIKSHMQYNSAFKDLFGDLAADAEKWRDDLIMLNRGEDSFRAKEATVIAYGIGGNLVSQHFDLIIHDDLHNRENINTKDQLDKVKLSYNDTLDLLEPGGELLVIGTRWHDDDLYGQLIDPSYPGSRGFEVFFRSAITSPVISRGEQGRYEISSGEILWPAKYDKAHLTDLINDKGLYEFSAQYQNNPIDDENAVFQRQWFHHYDPEDLKGRKMVKITAIDPAISLKERSDFTAIVTVGMDVLNKMYVLEVKRDRYTEQEMADALFDTYVNHNPQRIIMETVAFQKVLQNFIQKEMRSRDVHLPIEEVKPDSGESKEKRIRSLQPFYMRGDILHHSSVTNIDYLEDELLRFPKGRNDDVIDALAYAVANAYPPRKPSARPVKYNWMY